ncbi:MAG: penicillin-binding protein 2, partial [Thermocrinis sp.]|nr:penicillin-binding protein 2 [Thermocrinis sp.]
MRRRNFLLVLLLSVFLYLALVFRLSYLQIFKREYYKNLAKRNYIRRRVVYAQRGDILDRNGVKLAYDIPEYALFLDPQLIEEKSTLEETLKNLDELFGIKLSYEFLQSKKRSVEPILLRKLESQEELDKFYNNSYRLPGVFINMLPKRFYTFGEECAHLLGYVGYPTQEHMEKYKERISFQSLVGRQGLERVFDEELLGWVGTEELIVNA